MITIGGPGAVTQMPGMAHALPRQDFDVILLLANRFNRDATAQESWQTTAKKAVEYYENKQWSDADIALRIKHKRPYLTFNKIRPLVKLVMGYFINNRTDIKYLPGNTGFGSAEIAGVLSHMSKATSEMSQLPYVDIDVALDGVLTGRGWYDFRLDRSSNIFGDGIWTAGDPFSIYPDAEGDSYDINKGSHVSESRWISIDEVEAKLGRRVAELARPLLSGNGPVSSMPGGIYEHIHEIAPWRRFGGDTEGREWAYAADSAFGGWIDTARKDIRMLDVQWYVPVMRDFIVDLNTGDFRPLPFGTTAMHIAKIKEYAATRGEQVEIMAQQTRRVRWTQMIGDIIVYDSWSPYSSFTKVGYFPYWRRGRTQGMVEPLFDPQDEINKRRNARLEIISRTANGGWMYPEGMLSPQQKSNLENNGSRPGVHVEWKSRLANGQVLTQGPQQITAATSPVAHQQLESEAEGDLNEISGINKAALGQLDKVESGEAIKAKQRQAVVGLEDFMANYHRSKELMGRKQLEVYQEHYKSERVIRAIGPGSTPVEQVINQITAAGIINNIALGKYSVEIDDVPLARTYLEAQFNELMEMLQQGLPIPDDFVIDASSITRKEELKAAMAVQRQQEAAQAALAPPAEGQGGQGGPPAPPKAGGARKRPAGAGGRPKPPMAA